MRLTLLFISVFSAKVLITAENEKFLVSNFKNPSEDPSNLSIDVEKSFAQIDSKKKSNLNAELLCVSFHSAVVGWNITNHGKNVTLEIKIIDISNNSQTVLNEHNDTRAVGEHFFSDLKNETEYTVTFSLEYEQSILTFKTRSSELLPLPWFNVTQIQPVNGNVTNVVVQWNYTNEIPPCNHFLEWWKNSTIDTTDPEKLNLPRRKSEAVIRSLLYDSFYHIEIIAAAYDVFPNIYRTKSIPIMTPSCHQVLKNVSLCRMTQNIKIKQFERYPSSSICSVNISWTVDYFIPDYYSITIEQLNPSNKTILEKNVTDNSSSPNLFLDEIELGICGQLYIRAFKYNEFAIASKNNCMALTEISEENQSPSTVYYVLIIIAFLLILLLTFSFGIAFLQKDKVANNVKLDLKKRYPVYINNKTSIELETEGKKSIVAAQKYQLILGKRLGKGAFGIVLKGTLMANNKKVIEVAVKTLRDNATTKEIEQFEKEISLMEDVGFHNNIVSLIGTCYNAKKPLLIVEYCSLGDLHTYLCEIKKTWANFSYFNPQTLVTVNQNQINSKYMVQNKIYGMNTEDVLLPELSVCDLLSFGRQVAIGMDYLASNYVVHRDLAARNVLLCNDKTVKISDFGLSRDIYVENIYRKSEGSQLLPIKWMAIESIGYQEYTTQSDVWSFGVFLWELFSLGDEPYPGIKIGPDVLYLRLKSGYRMFNPCPNYPELYNIMLNCWQEDPNSRPQFSMLCEKLDQILRTCSPHQYITVVGMNSI